MELGERLGEPVDLVEGDGGAVELGHGDGTVERDDRRRGDGHQLVVQRDDLIPGGRGNGRGVAVDRVDRGLDLVRPRHVAPEARTHQRLTLVDQRPVPPGAVLIGQQHERSRRTRCGRSDATR